MTKIYLTLELTLNDTRTDGRTSEKVDSMSYD